jgi:very-short-patch-repair endonuclease
MAAGSDAALSHRSAADLWGLRPSSGRIEVTVPRGGHPVRGILVHQSRALHPADFTVEDGIPVTTVARTLLDLAAILNANDLEVAIDRAESLGLFDLTAVVQTLERARGRKGARRLRAAVAAYRPSTQKSKLERRFRALLEETRDLASPVFNALLEGEAGTHEVDAFWQELALAVQVDGFEFHRTRRDRERDAASDADLELAGYRVMRFTWDDVTVHGDRTLRRLRLAAGLTPPAGARGEPYGPRAP